MLVNLLGRKTSARSGLVTVRRAGLRISWAYPAGVVVVCLLLIAFFRGGVWSFASSVYGRLSGRSPASAAPPSAASPPSAAASSTAVAVPAGVPGSKVLPPPPVSGTATGNPPGVPPVPSSVNVDSFPYSLRPSDFKGLVVDGISSTIILTVDGFSRTIRVGTTVNGWQCMGVFPDYVIFRSKDGTKYHAVEVSA